MLGYYRYSYFMKKCYCEIWARLLCIMLIGFSSTALAIDCKREKDKIEKVICGSKALHEQDDKMTTAYEKLKKALPKKVSLVMLAMQKDWLKSRKACSKPVDKSSPTECLTKMYIERIELFDAAFANREAPQNASLDDIPYLGALTRGSIDPQNCTKSQSGEFSCLIEGGGVATCNDGSRAQLGEIIEGIVIDGFVYAETFDKPVCAN